MRIYIHIHNIMPTTSHLLALFLITIGPLSAFLERPFLRSNPSSKSKINFYRLGIATQWLTTAAAIYLVGWAALFHFPGGAPIHAQAIRLSLTAILTAFFFLGMLPFFQSLRSMAVRQAVGRAVHRAAGDFPAILPANPRERRYFAALSITAGICEETLFRGFLIPYLTVSLFHLPLWLGVLISSFIFGLNHLYQGLKGLRSTAIAGLAFGTLFLLTGSLLLPMLLHAAIDLQVNFPLSALPDPEKT